MEKLKSLKGLMALKEKVRLYVPSNMQGVEDLKVQNKMAKKVEKSFSLLFGGCTTYIANGSFVMDNGSLCKEVIIIVEAYTNELTNEKIDMVIGIGESIKNGMFQEAVSLEINNNLYFI